MLSAPVLTIRRPQPQARVDQLIRRLEAVRDYLGETEERVPLSGFGPSEASARNLLHYVALRRFDLREIQDRLADLGLSSLGRSEGHVLYNLNAILGQLYLLAGRQAPPATGNPPIEPGQGRQLLARNAARLFGPPTEGRETRIMVTLPTEAALSPLFLRNLLAGGVECVRINCAHDSEPQWLRMIEHLHKAERELGRRCRVEMDLGGPRLRTGPIEPGPAVLKVRPERDPNGRPLRPARVRFCAPGLVRRGAPTVEGELTAPLDWIGRRRRRERIQLRDSRGAQRTLRVESHSPGQIIATVSKTTYFTNGLSVRGRSVRGRPDSCVVAGVEPRPGRIRLAPGDWIRLSSGRAPGHDRRPRGRGSSAVPTIGVTIPEVLDQVRKGHRVWFDGGRIGGTVHSTTRAGALVRVEHAPPEGTWLRADQGINLPDTPLLLPPLTSQDRHDLRFIVRHSDLVGYSFVQSAEDLEVLREELKRLHRPKMDIILKIETRRAFEQLPAILLSALRSGPTGVMVARGDLAVEVGFERLAEVQEEILWLCEAAHLPAVWATQVLEGLAKSGIPSRAEVTDAAMGERAECVMLNKGPYLVQAVQALDSIIRRMQAHQAKKSARMRHLEVAERFLAPGPSPSEREPTVSKGHWSSEYPWQRGPTNVPTVGIPSSTSTRTAPIAA